MVLTPHAGVNTSVVQLQAQLDNAAWELSQMTVRAPADGFVTVVANHPTGKSLLFIRSRVKPSVQK